MELLRKLRGSLALRRRAQAVAAHQAQLERLDLRVQLAHLRPGGLMIPSCKDAPPVGAPLQVFKRTRLVVV